MIERRRRVCVWLFSKATKKDKKGENYLVLNGHKVQ